MLTAEQLTQIDEILERTLNKQTVLSQVQDCLADSLGRSHAQ